MGAALVLALVAYARTGNLAQSVDIVSFNTQTLFQFLTHLLGPRLCTKHAHFQLKLVAAPWALFHGFAQEHSVAGGTAQNGGAKVVHQGHLLLGVT